jgi:putative membrane protein insertion efficiency factor
MKSFLIFLTKVYKVVVTPILVGLFGHGCKFTPTCSEYTGQAIERFGIANGLWLGTKRFLRCHPFSKGNFDPVPELAANKQR